MQNYHSILEPIAESTNAMVKQGALLPEIKQHIIYEVHKHQRMNSTDKQTIIRNVMAMPSIPKLVNYLYQSILKFTGYGVI